MVIKCIQEVLRIRWLIEKVQQHWASPSNQLSSEMSSEQRESYFFPPKLFHVSSFVDAHSPSFPRFFEQFYHYGFGYFSVVDYTICCFNPGFFGVQEDCLRTFFFLPWLQRREIV